MRKFNFLMFAFLLLSNICLSQKLNNLKIIEKGENIVAVEFGKENDLFVLNNRQKVLKYNTNSLSLTDSYNLETNKMDFSKAMDLLVLGDTKGNLLFYNGNRPIKTIKAHNNKITCLKFSPSGKYIATSSINSSVKIWSTQSFELVSEIDNQTTLITDIQFSLDELFLVFSTSNGKIAIWSLPQKQIVSSHQLHKTWIRNISICPDNLKFATCGDDKKITIFSFKDDDYYQLTKSHRNIITNIGFIDESYLLSIGHDHRIVMNNINLPSKKEEVKHFKGYPGYYGFLFELPGDKYLSDFSVSKKDRIIAISSFGKGVVLTDYFHNLIEKPHVIQLKEIGNHVLDTANVSTEFRINKNPAIIKGMITRPEEIKNARLYFVNNDKSLKLRVDKKGEFIFQVPIFEESSDYSIIVEDWDHNFNPVHYDFKLIKSD